MGGGKFIDITGQRYGRWTALEYAGRRNHVTYWRCQCDCGATHDVNLSSLRNGVSTQCRICGCRSRITPPNIYKCFECDGII